MSHSVPVADWSLGSNRCPRTNLANERRRENSGLKGLGMRDEAM